MNLCHLCGQPITKKPRGWIPRKYCTEVCRKKDKMAALTKRPGYSHQKHVVEPNIRAAELSQPLQDEGLWLYD